MPSAFALIDAALNLGADAAAHRRAANAALDERDRLLAKLGPLFYRGSAIVHGNLLIEPVRHRVTGAIVDLITRPVVKSHEVTPDPAPEPDDATLVEAAAHAALETVADEDDAIVPMGLAGYNELGERIPETAASRVKRESFLTDRPIGEIANGITLGPAS